MWTACQTPTGLEGAALILAPKVRILKPILLSLKTLVQSWTHGNTSFLPLVTLEDSRIPEKLRGAMTDSQGDTHKNSVLSGFHFNDISMLTLMMVLMVISPRWSVLPCEPLPKPSCYSVAHAPRSSGVHIYLCISKSAHSIWSPSLLLLASPVLIFQTRFSEFIIIFTRTSQPDPVSPCVWWLPFSHASSKAYNLKL